MKEQVLQMLSQRNSLRRRIIWLKERMNVLDESPESEGGRPLIYKLYVERNGKIDEYWTLCREIRTKLYEWSKMTGMDDPQFKRYLEYSERTRQLNR